MSSPRREFLKGTAILAGSAFLFVKESEGHALTALRIEPQEKGEPILFDSPEVMTVAAIASQIVPTTDQPGAAEVGVVVYVNSEVRKSPELAKIYRDGVASLNRTSSGRFGKPFYQASWDQQTELLQSIEGTPFFAAVRRHTVEVFYTSPVGLFVASGYRASSSHGLCSANEGYPDIDQKPQ